MDTLTDSLRFVNSKAYTHNPHDEYQAEILRMTSEARPPAPKHREEVHKMPTHPPRHSTSPGGNFIKQLRWLVTSLSTRVNNEGNSRFMLSWRKADGLDAFTFHDTKACEQDMARFFSTSKWESLKRQLNNYGFVRLLDISARGSTWFHPEFTQDGLTDHLVHKVKTAASLKKKKASPGASASSSRTLAASTPPPSWHARSCASGKSPASSKKAKADAGEAFEALNFLATAAEVTSVVSSHRHHTGLSSPQSSVKVTPQPQSPVHVSSSSASSSSCSEDEEDALVALTTLKRRRDGTTVAAAAASTAATGTGGHKHPRLSADPPAPARSNDANLLNTAPTATKMAAATTTTTTTTSQHSASSPVCPSGEDSDAVAHARASWCPTEKPVRPPLPPPRLPPQLPPSLPSCRGLSSPNSGPFPAAARAGVGNVRPPSTASEHYFPHAQQQAHRHQRQQQPQREKEQHQWPRGYRVKEQNYEQSLLEHSAGLSDLKSRWRQEQLQQYQQHQQDMLLQGPGSWATPLHQSTATPQEMWAMARLPQTQALIPRMPNPGLFAAEELAAMQLQVSSYSSAHLAACGGFGEFVPY